MKQSAQQELRSLSPQRGGAQSLLDTFARMLSPRTEVTGSPGGLARPDTGRQALTDIKSRPEAQSPQFVVPLPREATLPEAGGTREDLVSPLPENRTMRQAGGQMSTIQPTSRPASPTPTPTAGTTKISNMEMIAGVPKQYAGLIQQAAKQYGVSARLLSALLKQESGFNPTARSHAGALGIAQFMPATAKGFGIDPLDPTQAIPAAAKYLRDSFDVFGSWELALAAYNAGGGNVGKYGGIPPFPETQNYVRNIMAMVNGGDR